jgi:hypothetical protein
MAEPSLRDKIRTEIQRAVAADLLPHQRRDALFVLAPEVDILEVAVAIAEDDTTRVERHLEEGSLERPTLAQMAEWCVDRELVFQFVILQPYVIAQRIVVPLS